MNDRQANPWRRSLGLIALVAIALMAVLAVIGAFLGAERATKLFNSVPMAACWIALTVLLLIALTTFKRLRRRGGLLAAHAGCVLLLVGAMYGSQRGHDLAGKLTGRPRVRAGYMVIARNNAADEIRDADNETLAALPFRLWLEDFWTEYYEPADLVLLERIPDGNGARAGMRLIPWAFDRPTPVGDTDITLRVLQYLPNAAVVFEGAPRGELVIQPASGGEVRLADDEGRQVTLSDPKLTVRIIRRYGNLRWVLRDGERAVEDVGGPPFQPALLLVVETPDGRPVERLLYAGLAMTHPPAEDVEFRYDFPPPVAARPDPTGHEPAMEIELTRGDRRLRRWLLAERLWRDEAVDLADLLTPAGTPEATGAQGPILAMTRRFVPVRAHKTALVVLADGREATRKVISAGRPLHYGGYHFYPTDQPYDNEDYVTLIVRSDAGLWPVYAGSALLCAGVFGALWLRPAWAYIKRR